MDNGRFAAKRYEVHMLLPISSNHQPYTKPVGMPAEEETDSDDDLVFFGDNAAGNYRNPHFEDTSGESDSDNTAESDSDSASVEDGTDPDEELNNAPVQVDAPLVPVDASFVPRRGGRSKRDPVWHKDYEMG